MSDTLTLDLRGIKEFQEKLRRLKQVLVKDVKDVFNVNSLLLVTHIRQDLISFAPGLMTGGTSDTTLASRSGMLKKSIRAITAKDSEKGVEAGLTIGTIYARVHFGPRGQITEITPKNSKYLTIPLPAAQGSHGQAKGRARDEGLWGETFVAKSKAGNLIIFGKKKYLKGAHAGETRGGIEALFLLVKSVRVPARIDPQDLLKWSAPQITRDLREAIQAWPSV
jgi:hypothetical protein